MSAMDTTVRSGRKTLQGGLAQGRLGVGSLIFFTVSASAPMTVLVGGVVVAMIVTGNVGMPLAFPILAVALGVFAVGYAAMSRYVFNAGAFYTYIAQGLGRAWGVAASFVALVSYNGIQIGLYGLFGVILGGFASQHFHTNWTWWVWSLIAFVVIGLLGILKIDLNSKILAVLLVCEVLAVLAFDFGAFTHPNGGTITFGGLNPHTLFTSGVGGAFAFGIAAFTGFESAPTYSEEARDRTKTVARATYAAVAITGILYTVSAWGLTVQAGPSKVIDAVRDPNSTIPFSMIASDYGKAGNTISDIANVLLITSIFAALLSFHNVVARYTYSAGRERVIPRMFAATSVRSNAPWVGSLAQSALAVIVVAVFVLANHNAAGDSPASYPVAQLFTWLSYIAAVGILLLMIGTSIAVIGFFARRSGSAESIWQRVLAPALAAIVLIAVVWVTAQNSSSILGTAKNSPLVWVLPGILFAVAVIGLIWGLILRSAKPDVYAGIGRGGLEEQTGSAAWHHPSPHLPSHGSHSQ